VLTLFLFFLFAFIGYLAFRFFKLKREHHARYGDPPERTFLEVKLPADMKDGEGRMQNFYRKVKDATSADNSLRREGKRQIDILYLVAVPEGQLTPVMTTYIVCDPDKASIIKRSLRSAFAGQAYFGEVKTGDPLHDVLNALLEEGRSDDEKHKEEEAELEPA
jgi:hypothetical protein